MILKGPTLREQAIAQGMIRAMSFADWVTQGSKTEKGTVDILVRPAGFGYIKPYRFPSERLYFKLDDIPKWQRKNVKRGAEMVFDVPPQQYDDVLTHQAKALGLVMPR